MRLKTKKKVHHTATSYRQMINDLATKMRLAAIATSIVKDEPKPEPTKDVGKLSESGLWLP